MEQNNQLSHDVIEAIHFYKGFVLDAVEQELGDKPNWQFVRSRLLKAFGDRGLEGRIREIIGKDEA